MKATLKVMLVLCALAASAAAQSVGDPVQEVPGLAVSGFDWKYEGYMPFEVVRSEKTAESIKHTRGTDYVFKYVSRLTVKNSGPKAIKSLEWGHVFSDPETGKELKRYRLKSVERIAPGETPTLVKAVFIKPGESTRHLNAGEQRVEVTRVEYEDGTVWRANVSEGHKP
jgi:hypothetical protein